MQKGGLGIKKKPEMSEKCQLSILNLQVFVYWPYENYPQKIPSGTIRLSGWITLRYYY